MPSPSRSSAHAAGVLAVFWRVPEGAVAEFGEWYDREHIPQRLEVTGFVSARRFEHVDDPGRQVCMFDLEAVDVLRSDGYLALGANPTKWAERIIRLCTVEARDVYVIATELGGPESAAAVWAARFEGDAAEDLGRFAEVPGVVRARGLRSTDDGHVLAAVDAVTASVFDREPFVAVEGRGPFLEVFHAIG